MTRETPQVDGYLRKQKKWAPVLAALRRIVLECPLAEEVKWRVPCYTFEGRNVVFISALKEYCALSFIKGALLKDPDGLLQQPGENTQSARLIRFTQVDEVQAMEPILKAYVAEAVEIERAGPKVAFKKITEHAVPDEFQKRLDRDSRLKDAFEALTPGRRRAYLLHFASPKQSKTREARIDKCTPMILEGIGIDDDYRRKSR